MSIAVNERLTLNQNRTFNKDKMALHMYYLFVTTITLLIGAVCSQVWRPAYCPCICSFSSGPQLTLALGPGRYKQVDCRYQNMNTIPANFPLDTEVLLLGNNNIPEILPRHWTNLPQMMYLDLSHNHITRLKDGTFETNGQLRYLSLSWNQLVQVSEAAFPSPSRITRLLLSGNKLGFVPAAVKLLPQLVVVDLASNGILKVPADAFDGLANLQFINLKSNSIQRIAGNAFANLPALVNIQLSQNSINTLRPDAFHNLPRLTTISLGYNTFTALPANQFINIPSVEVIHLEGNQITRLPANIFQPLRSLQEINFENNGLEFMPPSLFRNRNTLQKVHLAGNEPTPPVSSALFTNLPNLISLSLSQLPEPFTQLPPTLVALKITDTPLRSIPSNYFQHLPNLETLTLAENRISSISMDAFAGLAHLRQLDLSANNLTSVPSWMFEGNMSSTLETLSLQENRIERVYPHAFSSLSRLSTLYLEANLLQEVLPDMFPDSLEYLQLGENPIKYFDVEAIQGIPALRLVSVDSRNLHCDCLLQHFVDWVRANRVIVDGSTELICRTPRKLQGKGILRVNQRQLVCNRPQITTSPKVQNIVVDAGFNTTLPCSLLPSSIATLRWNTAARNRLTMSNSFRTEYEINQVKLLPTGTLIVMNVSPIDAGTYTCTASNPSGTDVITYLVAVNQPSQTTTVDPIHGTNLIPVRNDTEVLTNRTISPTDQSLVNISGRVTPISGTVVPPRHIPNVTVSSAGATTAQLPTRGPVIVSNVTTPKPRVTLGDIPLEREPHIGGNTTINGGNTTINGGNAGRGGRDRSVTNPPAVSTGPKAPSRPDKGIPDGEPGDPSNPCNPNPCLHRGSCKVVTVNKESVEDSADLESYSDSIGTNDQGPAADSQPVVHAKCICRKRFGGPTCDIRKPENPVKVTVLQAQSEVISLKWEQESTANVDGFKIYYGLVGNDGMSTTLPIHPDVNSFSVEELKEGSTYRICVVAFNEGGDSLIGDQNCIWAETPSNSHPLESFLTTEYGIIGGGILFVILLTLLTAICYSRGKKERDYERRVVVPRVTQSVADLPASNVFRRSLKPADSSYYQDDMMLLDFSKNEGRKMYMNPFDSRQSIIMADNEHINPPLGFGEGIPASLLPNNRRTLRIQEDMV